MQSSRDKALTTLRDYIAGQEPDPERMKDAAEWAVAALDFDAESITIEEFNGVLTATVELTTGVVIETPEGGSTNCDKVRLRVPTTEDEWARDSILVELGTTPERSPALAELAMAFRVVVDWEGLPLPRFREDLMAMSRYDAGRLCSAYSRLEDHAERVALEKKLSRRASSS